MADIISRLKLESGEFDSKIKRAGQELLAYSEHCKKFSLQMGFANKDAVEFAKQLGSMATTSTTVRGKINELSEAFINLKVMYNNMTDKEKEHPFGKNLAASLDQLKGRINDAKDDLANVTKELNNTGKQSQETGGFLDKLKDRFVVNLDAMKLFNVGLKAAKGALNVVKDAFLASEANVDMWGRTMEASEALYEGFCNALNRSDFTGFLSRIDEIVSAAKEAYNALDELGTYRTIQRPENAKRAAEETRLRTMLRTGRYIASTSGAKSAYGLKEGDVLTDEARAGYQRSLERLMTQTISETRRNISKTQNAVDKLYNEIASFSGISRSDFKNTIQNWDTYQSTFRDVKNYNDWNDKNVPWYVKAGSREAYQLYVGAHNPYYNSRTLAWRDFKDSGDKFNRAQSLAEESYGLSSQLYSSQMRNSRALNAGGSSGGRGGGRSGGRGGGRGNGHGYEPKTQVIDMKPMEGLGMPDIYDRWGNKIEIPQARPLTPEQRMRNEILTQGQGILSSIPSLVFPEQSEEARAYIKRKSNQYDREQNYAKLGEKFDESSKTWADMNSNLNNIVAGVEGLGIEVPSGFKKMIGLTQTVSTIMSGISSILLLINTTQWTSKLIPGIGLHAGGVVRAATGTVVPGNYGFDAVPALLTSGETVLTRAQAGNIASQLQQGSKGESTMQPYTTGEYVYLGVKNHLQRNGQGEIVTTGMLRRMGLIA
ncbi:MAG: hypothetical protein IKO67_01295 [Bacteroidaceae bacterium]|nr:hypothetical protein [Bacteroidaceae bacterium]